MFKILNICDIDYKIYSNGTIIREYDNLVIEQQISKCGYCCINVGKGKNRSKRYVHRLVAECFCNINNLTSDELKKLTVNHKNHNKCDNNYNNLEWVTREYNASESYSQKDRGNVGEKNKNSKLKKEDVLTIRNLLLKDENIKYIAELYNVSISTIKDIKNYRTWKNI